MKKKLILLALLIAILTLTSCSSGSSLTMERDGTIKKYTITEIFSDEKFGFYVRNEDNTFSPVMSDTPGRESGITGNKNSIWWCDYTTNNRDVVHENLIPIVTEKTPLVAIYGADSEMPSTYRVEEYEDMGYTVGAKFQIGSDKNSLYFSVDDICPNSTFTSIAERVPDDLTRVIEINELDKLPLGNIDKTTGVMLGLQEGKYYKFTCYVGTSTRGYTVSADTRIFKQKNSFTLDLPLTETRQHYFIVNLPSNLSDGYYYINDAGMFKVGNHYVEEKKEPDVPETEVLTPEKDKEKDPIASQEIAPDNVEVKDEQTVESEASETSEDNTTEEGEERGENNNG